MVILKWQVWFQNRRAKFRRNERSSAINRGSSVSREMEASLPLRPIRINHAHESSSPESLQSHQVSQYPYGDYWRSAQHYSAVQTTASCHGFVNGGLSNMGLPSYHQSEVHSNMEGSSINGLSALRLRSHPYGSAYSAMHASM
jgi:paired mesoderm homeobox protein